MPTIRGGNGRRHLLEEIAKFLAVGGVATVVSLVGFNGLVHGVLIGVRPMAGQPVLAYVLANLVGGVVAYLGMRWWAFEHREVREEVAGAVTFFVLGAATMTIPVICLAVSRYGLGLSSVWADNISANIVGLGLGTAARFWVFRRYVFRESATAVGASPI